MSKFHSLKIKSIKRETTDAVSITFDIPENLKTEFQFVAGQYITLKITINNQEVRRAYSLCSSPNLGEITIAVKQIQGGNFSVFATTKLKEGDTIEVSKPEGKFVLNTNSSNTKNYLAFAAGSGITPIMSMIKAVLEIEKNSTFTLVFGNKSTDKTIFFDKINQLKEQYKSQFFVQYVFSKEQPKNALFGRIDSSVVNYILKQHKKVFDGVFLCGPEQMIITVKDSLIAKDFSEDNIHFELFKSKYKKEENTMNENLKLDGESDITILLDDEKTTFKMKQSENILTAALAEDLDAPYSCQGGICSSCMAKVVEGKAVMKTNNILSEEEVEAGFILTCEAHPTTPKIVIDYDDV